MNRVPKGFWFSFLVLAAFTAAAGAEVFVLENGGRVVGDLTNPNEIPREKYVVRTSEGMLITLDRRQVKQILRPRPEELEYEKIWPRCPDTIEEQWKLAEWCRERLLIEQRQRHLRRILELDPDHKEARRALGYDQFDGRWMTQEEVMIGRGYVRHGGKWMLPQEIQLEEEQRTIELAEKQWMQKLERWLSAGGGEKGREAYQAIAAIHDPFAVKALAQVLKSDPRDPVRILVIEVLAKIGTVPASQALAACAVEDPVEEVRLTALDYLKQKDNPAAVDHFIGRLRSKDNTEVNRAAAALKAMNHPTAIAPLIDALVTTHKYQVGSGGGPGQISTTFSSSGPGGLSVGNRPKIVTRQVPNREVLDALVSMTSVNFQFDKAKWKAWDAARRRQPGMDARRD